jgi:hypothetical protein
VRVFFRLGQKAQVDADTKVFQRVVDEPGMPGFVTAHIAEQLLDIRIGDLLLDFGIKDAAGEFRRQGTDQKIDKFLPEFGR